MTTLCNGYVESQLGCLEAFPIVIIEGLNLN